MVAVSTSIDRFTLWALRAHLRVMSTHTLRDLERLGLEPMLSVADLSTLLGVPVGTIYDWRTRGCGPVAHRVGKHLRYAVADVSAWMATRRDDADSGVPDTVVRIPHHRAASGSVIKGVAR